MLNNLIQNFRSHFNAEVKLGAELEFYTDQTMKLEKIKQLLGEKEIEEEEGKNQYEVRIGPTTQIEKLIKQLINLQIRLNSLSSFHSSPKPFSERPSNGVHIHINLQSFDAKKNLFDKSGEKESNFLLYSVGGLLSNIKKDLKFFAPSQESLERYKPGMNNPTKICWGGNNRTAAIRIPLQGSGDRRIEHRVPASDCDAEKTITAILKAMYDGISKKILPPEKIHGNAFLDIYNAEKLI